MPSFVREHPLAERPSPAQECVAFLFRERELLVEAGEAPQPIRWSFARIESESEITNLRRLGNIDGMPCYAGYWNGGVLPSRVEARELRELYGVLDETIGQIAGLAIHLLHWDRTHAFCGVCGARTALAVGEHARRCPACDYLAYPRIAPSVIVAVTRGDRLLLARSTRFKYPMFSVLAGFVEPGETLEECVHREVREEVGIEVQDLQYFGSQPWPYPDSLMIGFTASYASGELVLEPSEIVEAGWFRRDEFPPIPGRQSISRRLIDWFVSREWAR